MADTQTLLALIEEFPQPFLDPEATPAPEPVLEEVVSDLLPAQHTPELTWREECEFSLNNISSDPELRRLAANLLENLSDLAGLRRVWPAGSNPDLRRFDLPPAGTQQPLPSVWDDALTEFEIPNLPETHARQGGSDCPSGMCPIDH